MQQEASDEALMGRAQDGDREAFADLYVRHRPALTAFLTRFTGSAALAEDLSQESFVRLWEARGRFETSRKFKIWLYVAAKNLAINALKARREQSLPEELAEPTMPRPSVLGELVSEALQALPEAQRLVLVLTVYEQFSHKEAAEALGCTEVSARVLAFRARQALKRRVAPLLERGYETESI
ncbi:RNA polymerase sigma factor [Armatimonas sp.]|uniref:RNA polymerase sigma factor n=1 Tax=Armatimonas sp. TaxID=1872638 RepID=UPI00286C847F|nr:RNA polymerase sigma factor [Armatimonas sp.]